MKIDRYIEFRFQMLLVKKKNIYEKFDTELKVPPVLNVQIWDNDTFSPDDFLGSLTINLSHFPKPFATPTSVSEKEASEYRNLFLGKKERGWFPVIGKDDSHERELAVRFEL